MMRLFIILLISTGVKAQKCDTSMIYGMKLRFEVDVNTNRWNYYTAKGVKAWGNVNGFDSTLIPKGGYAMRVTVSKVIDGYGDLKIFNPNDCEYRLYRAFDGNLQEIDGYVKSWKFKN